MCGFSPAGESAVSERLKQLAADVARWAKEAAMSWAESAQMDTVQHAYSVVIGVILALAIYGLW